MQTNSKSQNTLAFIVVLLVSCVAFAQEGGIRIKLKAEPSAAPTKDKRVLEAGIRPPKNNNAPPVSLTTGALAVVSESKATIYLQKVGAQTYMDKQEISTTQSQVVFNNLKPGNYRVVAECDGFEDNEKIVAVKAKMVEPVDLRLKLELYNVTVKANVPTGDVKYCLSAGEDPKKYCAETPRFVRIANGKATISGLRAREYLVDIKADDAAYETILAAIDVGKGQTEFPVALKYVLCEQPFSESWVSLTSWEAPTTWKAASRKLTVNGAGWAIPKDDCPRHFADFELTTDVKLLNENGVSFVVRAHDNKNYYLIQLTGAKAAEPLLLRGIAYVNGVAHPLGRAIPLDAFAPNMTGKYFTVVLKAKGNLFEIFINDSQTGDELPLGKLTDPSKHFNLGAVGVAGTAGQQTEIARFIVSPTKR
ncbi:MAG: hypothetical protein HOP19_17110 [Acidobacteria bacterium]|nr:hypothetical protein [Acidobacteriota bacterium]